jgi:hypothetical protein
VPDPTIEAARDVLGDALGELRATLAGMSVDDLNLRPAGPSSNPLAVIAAHALSSTRSWLSLAMGAPLPERDRPAEFRTVADDDFLAWADARAAECRRLLEGDATFEPTRIGAAPWRSGDLAEAPVSAAWALLHALDHLGEHVGHAHLTRQLLDERG